MKKIIPFLILIYSCSLFDDAGDDFSALVETDVNGIIIIDKEDQWQPRIENNWTPNSLPTKFGVYPAYPNPLTDSTTVNFTLPVVSKTLITARTENAKSDTLLFTILNAGFHNLKLTRRIQTGNTRLEIIFRQGTDSEIRTYGNVRKE